LEEKTIAKAVQVSRKAIYDTYKDNNDNNSFLPTLLSCDIEQNLIVDWNFVPNPHINSAISLHTLSQLTFPSNFIGRGKEFRIFYDKLYDDKLSNFLVYGEGGMGKSAIVGNFALELLRKGYKVFDLSFKSHSPIKRFMEKITDKAYDEKSNSIDTFQNILETLSKKHSNKIVFIFDNLESVQDTHTKEINDPLLDCG